MDNILVSLVWAVLRMQDGPLVYLVVGPTVEGEHGTDILGEPAAAMAPVTVGSAHQ